MDVADAQLLQYIVQQEHSGYNETQIRQALAANGYQQPDIEAAFRELGPAQMDPVVHEYVQQYARQGYPPVQIFTTLTQQGYTPKVVRKAINDVFGPLVMPQRHTGTIIFAAIAILVAVAGFYFITGDRTTPQPPIGQVPGGLPSTTEQISAILFIAEQKGKETAVRECTARLIETERDRCISAVATYPSVSDDRLCDQVTDPTVHDACLLSFFNTRFESVCSRMKLRDNVDTCDSVRALRA
jgi:hypothetical protein